ncbi:MAG: class I SAM-dependent methyltransferase [Acidobacteria bacterium]|nr:class I SAM-dependent methyltransferase [Acidobacteriota bacterium]
MTQSDCAQAASVFDRLSQSYDRFNENPQVRRFRDAIYKMIDPWLSPDASVLDFGCGPGSDFPFWLDRGLSVDAYDISPQMVDVAKSKLPVDCKINVRLGSLDELEGPYDVILANFGVWNALPSDLDVHQQMRQHLNPGGVLIVVVMPPLHLMSAFSQLLSGDWSALWRRLHHREAVTSDGWLFSYVSRSSFAPSWQVIDSRSLGPLLSTPAQSERFLMARFWNALIRPLDRLVSRVCWFGGDHLVLVLKNPN